MTVSLASPLPASVYVEGDAVVISQLRVVDAELAALIVESDDAEAALRGVLAIGTRAAVAAQGSLDAHVVDRRFAELTVDFERRLSEFGRDFERSAERLLRDDDGPLRSSLVGCFKAIRELVDQATNGNAETLGKLEQVLDAAGREQVSAVRALVSPESPGSPLLRLQDEIVRAVGHRTAALEQAIARLAETVAVDRGRAEVREKTTGKGLAFERQVVAALEQECTPLGETVTFVGGTAGAEGTRDGDALVSVALGEDAAGVFVLEMKDKKLGSTDSVLGELAAAERNRPGAQASIMVVSRQEYAPISEPFATFGSRRAIVVYDKDDPDPRALRLACAFARWVVRRQLATAGEQANLARVQQLLERARASLSRIKAIEDGHGLAKKALEKAGHELDALKAELDRALAAAAEEIGASAEASATRA